jgi:hypothetical protein
MPSHMRSPEPRPAEEPLPDEIEAIRLGEAEFARGKCRRLEDVQRELGLPTGLPSPTYRSK